MTPDTMTVRMHLYRIRVLKVLVDMPEHLEVLIHDLRSVVRCPFCGFKTTKVHETRRVKVSDVPRGRQRVTLIWLRRRFHCTNCGERHSEKHPAIEGRMTTRLARAIVTDARHLSITEIGRRYGFAWHTVMTLVREWSGRLQVHRRSKRCRILLVDETVRHEALVDRVRCKTSPPGCRSSPVKLRAA
ncbi:MAG: transposase family protein [Actinomycetota bacterium]